MEIQNIKLVVWDLDDTFWQGTLTEGEVSIPEENLQLVKDLTDCGIINSICSKNDFEPVRQRLQEAGIWDYFVFPSVNWDSKGPRMKELLDNMALRPANTLFLDDKPSNLGEVQHFLPDIQIGGPDIIHKIAGQVQSLDPKDKEHKRLKQYKILEKKHREASAYESNEAFLYSSHIQVEIHHCCLPYLDRLHELLMRSNQLNYTKKRIGIDELEALLKNKDYDCGYVTVKDAYGDYGIVGFYAMTDSRLEHFLFSCRTMGQKIEQWVYAQLGFPQLEVTGEVRSPLNNSECPAWINQPRPETNPHSSPHSSTPHSGLDPESQRSRIKCGMRGEVPAGRRSVSTPTSRILLKGPCDLSHSQVYIKDAATFDTEFTYVSNADGQIIDAHNHSVHIRGLHEYSPAVNREIAEDCLFVDPAMLKGNFFTKAYDIIFLSTLIESDYNIYRKKGSHIQVVFGGPDLTNPENWDNLCKGKCYTAGNRFTLEWLKGFAEKYEYAGQTTPEAYVTFLRDCEQWLPPKTHLCLILGATKVFEGDEKTKQKHRALNDAVLAFADSHPRVQYIEIDEFIHGTDDFAGGINHFSTRVYYELARAMIRVIEQDTGMNVKSYSSGTIVFDSLLLKVRKSLKRILHPNGKAYKAMKKVYDKIYKKRNSQ